MSKLHVDSVIKTFGIKDVLTDIFVACEKGEIIGLLGKNGSGKSTLFKIIFGSLRSDRKFVQINNKRISSLFEIRNLVSYLPQDNFLPNHLKVKKIISIFCDKANSEKILSNYHIKPIINKKSKELSGGERRLVEILISIYSNAEFVLIDEPFNGIAPIYRDEIKNLIREESKNKGFIITDHDFRNIIDLSTRIILLHDGATKSIKHKDELEYWGYIPEKVKICQP